MPDEIHSLWTVVSPTLTSAQKGRGVLRGGREWHGIRIKKTPKIETMPFPYDISSTCQPQYESEWLAIKRRVKHL
jgi:hypothetical protein